MASYEFKCEVCSNLKEIRVPIGDDIPSPKCEYCMITMGRMYFAPLAKFKGTGFYSTDSKGK